LDYITKRWRDSFKHDRQNMVAPLKCHWQFSSV